MPDTGDSLQPLDALEAGATVVSANNRLARALTEAWTLRMLERGRRAWEASSVLPLEAFLAEQWRRLRERCGGTLPRLLSAAQSRALWQQAVEDDAAQRVLSTSAAADAAARANTLLQRYTVELHARDCVDHADASAFLAWQTRYRERLRDGGWVEPSAVATRLAREVAGVERTAPAVLQCVGFDQLTPQLRELLRAYRDAGVRLHPPPPAGPRGEALRVELESPEAELEAAARWARALLDDGAPGPIGVVLPDLAERLQLVEDCFEDVLHPASGVAPRPVPSERAFNVSLGRPLSRQRVVVDALSALATDAGELDAEAASGLLLSPYLAGADAESAARTALDASLRDEGVRRIRTRHLARLAARAGAPALARALEALIPRTPRRGVRAPFAEHAQRFASLLDTLGWPSARALDSGEHQAVEAFRDRLQALVELDAVRAPCTAPAARATLEHAVHEAVFQPRTGPAPIQILGVLEAAGLRFSHLWLAGFHDTAWPPAESASPLLPARLQREHAMPGASPSLALARARRMTERLLAAAPQVVASHAAIDGDAVQRPSPLLASVAACPPGALRLSELPLPDEALAQRAPRLEQFSDWQARPLGHGWRTRGGSRLLTDQAACPFRAFARHRLGARAVTRARAPLDARSRGTLAHVLMQELLDGLRDREAVLALDPSAREARAAQAAQRAVATVRRRHPGEIPSALARAERERMQALAVRWLELEASRRPFQVEALEQRRKVRIGGLELDVQLDRVDRVDGRRLLLDYKTGKASVAAWFGERPDEPQLPLYALALDAQGAASAPVAGLAFARLKRGQEGFAGVAEDPDWAPGLVPLGAGGGAPRAFADISALKSHWARVLDALAESFAQGQAAVDPKPGACRHCDLRALCRVDELAASAEDTDA